MSGSPADASRPISALEGAISTLRDQLAAAANGRAERAEERADAEREGRLIELKLGLIGRNGRAKPG
jgi:hypothetical protein